jgi:hypothetical protein
MLVSIDCIQDDHQFPCHVISLKGRVDSRGCSWSLGCKFSYLEIELLNSFNYHVVLLAYSNLSGDSLHSPIKQAYNTNV